MTKGNKQLIAGVVIGVVVMAVLLRRPAAPGSVSPVPGFEEPSVIGYLKDFWYRNIEGNI